MKLKIEEVRVTPKIAMELLSANTKNRPMSAYYVGLLTKQMADGTWQDNGETIKLTTDGVLVDGQHRLQAIVNSGKAQNLVIVRNVPPTAYATIDVGKRRTGADTLAVAGIKNYAVVAAAVRLILTLSDKSVNFSAVYSNAEIDEWARAYSDELQPWMRSGKLCAQARMLDMSIVVGLSHLFKDKRGASPEMIESFWGRIADGVGLNQGSPILALRRRMTENQLSNKKMSRKETVALVIKTWNAIRRGKPVTILSWRAQAGEEFPSIV